MKIILTKMILISFCLLVFSCEKIENFDEISTPRYAGNYAPTLTSNPSEIKIVTFNIEFAQEIEEAIKELGTSENLRDADIIFLQEMDEVGTEAIAEALSYNYVYYPANRNPDGQLFGLSILSKWPIIDDEKIILPHTPSNDRNRIAVSAEIIIGNQSVRVYNIHTATFTLPKTKRREQFSSLVTHLDSLEETDSLSHVLIAGDFNTDKSVDTDYLVTLYESEGFFWVSEGIGPTYQILSGLSQYTLDHVFTRGFELIEVGKIEETLASDHLPVYVELRL